jgi:RNA polymerase sigma factor (sigma-70 family)
MQVQLQDTFATHRQSLIRWFTKLTADPQTAEDLAQETLVEAWKNQHKLIDPEGTTRWINAIGANIYKRWCRQRGRTQNQIDLFDEMHSPSSVEVELERSELISLLDAAIDLLPPETQALLTARYLEEMPYAQLAKSLGTTENVVAVRLHRGKLMLRELMKADQAGDAWQSTRLWCMSCGRRTYESKFNPGTGELHLRCPHCTPPNLTDWSHVELPGRPMLQGLKSLKPALNRLMLAQDLYLRPALSSSTILCENCGTEVELWRRTPPEVAAYRDDWMGIYCLCSRCGEVNYAALSGVAISTPRGRQFWQAHPRIHLLPTRPIEYQGRAALVVEWESLQSAHHLAAIFAQDSHELLAMECDDE